MNAIPSFRIATMTLALLLLHCVAAADEPAQIAKSFIADFLAGDIAKCEARFTPEMKAAVGGGKLGDIAGSMKGCRAGEVAGELPLPAYRVITIPLECDNSRVNALVTIDNDGRVAGLFFRPAAPPTPAAMESSASWAEEEVTVGNKPWQLPGTLTLPRGDDRVPAVILLQGSGPNDRDETVLACKPFRDLAHGLASHGIAVLRYDKRTFAHGPAVAANMAGFTLNEEYVDDAVAAIALLRAHPRVDSKRLYILGHSLGGWALPRVASREPAIAGLIFCSAPARDLVTIMREQVTYISGLDGVISPEEKEALDTVNASGSAVAALKPSDASASTVILGGPPAYWLDLRANDPVAATLSVKAPMMFVQGGRDYQTTTTEAREWKSRFDAAGKTALWKYYPTLNHLLIPGEGNSTPDEYNTPGTVSPEVIADIATFIRP